MKRRFPLILLGFALVLGAWKLLYSSPPWRKALAQSPTLTLYSLEPQRDYWPRNTPSNAPKMDKSLILGLAIITDASEKAQLLRALDGRSDAHTACISEPRHALETSDKTVLFVACFECGQGRVAGTRFPSGSSPSLSGAAAPVFNATLKKHGVPLSHLGKEAEK